jgi:hypothetical protein
MIKTIHGDSYTEHTQSRCMILNRYITLVNAGKIYIIE